MTTQNVPDCLQNVHIGVNPLALSTLIESTTLTGEQIKRVKVCGLEHLPFLTADKKGLVPLTFKVSPSCGRFSTEGAFPLQSLPSIWRPALTATKEGKTLIYADWKSSHWQIIAYLSGDVQMIEDVENGDVYDLLRPDGLDDVSRKAFKVAGCAYLNGSGMPATKAALGSKSAAKLFINHIEDLFKTRWAEARGFCDHVRQKIFDNVGKDKHKALGVGLMKIEAHALLAVIEAAPFKKHFDLLLPMHDGLLVQCDEGEEEECADRLRNLMTFAITNGAVTSDDNGVHVDVEIHGTSWGQMGEEGSKEDVEVLTGEAIENAAYEALTETEDHARLLLAAALIPNDLRDAQKDHAPQSKAARAIKKALRAAVAARTWSNRKNEEKSDRPALMRRRNADGSIGPVENTSVNLQIVLMKDPAFSLWTNEWTRKIHNKEEEINYETFIHEMKVYLMNAYGWNCQCSYRDIEGSISYVAAQTVKHPLRDHIDSLPWDGKDRMDWLTEALYRNLEHDLSHYQISHDDYNMAALHGRNLVIGMMARLYEPGCKMDEVLVLSGAQGVGKQRIWLALLPDDDYYVGTSLAGMDGKDKAAVMRDAWIYDDQEMASGTAAREEAKKAFLSSAVDVVRLPYARSTEKIKRHCVIVGSTNEPDWLLKDVTGSRRYNVVSVPQDPTLPDWHKSQPVIDVEWVRENGPQILAQARDLYKKGEKWWIEKGEEEFGMRDRQNKEQFTAEDVWDAPARRVYEANGGGRPNKFSIMDFAQKSDPDLTTDKVAGRMAAKISKALKKAGFKGHRTKKGRYWYKPLPAGQQPHSGDTKTGLSAFHGYSHHGPNFRSNFRDDRDHHGGYRDTTNGGPHNPHNDTYN